MKTKLIFLVLLIASFSCGTNKSVSDSEKDKIKVAIKEVVNTFIKGCEEANFDMAIEPFFDSPDFVFINNGKTLSYKEVVDGSKPVFNTLLNQQITIIDEKYAFPDNSTVLYTVNVKSLANYKDGHSLLADPEVLLFIFKKIDNRWRVIYYVDSYVEQSVKSSGSSNELNQVELHKYFIGYWKIDVAKDTTVFWDVKSYGTGLEGYFKCVTKGKIFMEGKQIWGYDKSIDKFIMSDMVKGMDNVIYSTWFTSKNTNEMVLLKDISNPEKAPLKREVEIKSPDMFLNKTIVNNNIVKTDTYIRVKN
jgi:hypothetical protein